MDEDCTIGIPLRGILTLRGRNLPTEWECGVCKCPNSQIAGKYAKCKECEQPRVAKWMYNCEGQVVQPAKVIELPPGWQPDKQTSLTGELAALRGGKAVLAAKAATVNDPQIDIDLIDNDQANAANGEEGKPSTPDRHVVRQKESIDEGNLEEVKGKDEDKDEEDELDQQTSYTYGIVTDITRIRGKVFVYAFADEDLVDKTGATPPAGAPVGGTLRQSDVASLAVLDSGDEYDPRVEAFSHFGLCANCEAVYRIVDGDVAGISTQEINELKEELSSTTETLVELKSRRLALKKIKDNDRVLEHTAEIKEISKELRYIRRKLTPQQLWCPFCTWEPEY